MGEGSAVDDLAGELLSAADAEARETLLRESPTLDQPSAGGSDLTPGDRSDSRPPIRRKRRVVFERALEIAQRVGDRKVEGEALQNLANTFYFQRNFPRALGVPTSSGWRSSASATIPRRWPHRWSASATSAIRSRITRSRSRTIARRWHSRSRCPINRCGFHVDQHRQRQLSARRLSARDCRLSPQPRRCIASWPTPSAESMALAASGRVYVAQGNYAAAIEAFSGVLADGRARNDRRAQGSAQMSLGDVHIRLGNVTAARAALEDSRGAFRGHPRPRQPGPGLAGARGGRIAGGRIRRRRARLLAQRGDLPPPPADDECVASAAVGLGFAQATQEKFTEAVVSYTQAVGAFTALDRPEQAARAEIGLAQAQTGLERYADALASAARARQTAIALSQNDVLWRAQIAEAQAHRKSGAPDRALGAARAALYAVDELREATRDCSPAARCRATPPRRSRPLVRLQVDSRRCGRRV